MLELIGITLAITLGCNVLAGIGSYVTLTLTSSRGRGSKPALTGRIHLETPASYRI